MLLRIKTPFAGPGHSFMIDEYVDTDAKTGKSWIRHGMAEQVDAKKLNKDTEVKKFVSPHNIEKR